MSILASIRIRIQQFWPFQFSNSFEEESRIRPLFKVKFVALNIWQDYISEILIEEIVILRIVVLIKFTSLLKTHFSLAVAGAWFGLWHPVLRTNMNVSSININSFFALPSCLEGGELAALSIGGWMIVAMTLKTFCKFDVLSLLFTFSDDVFVLMGGKFSNLAHQTSLRYIYNACLYLFPACLLMIWNLLSGHGQQGQCLHWVCGEGQQA